MLDELRDRIIDYLARNRLCVVTSLTSDGTAGEWAIPARYCREGLELDLLIPSWADVVYYIEQKPQVLLIVQDAESGGIRWLQYRGVAKAVAPTDSLMLFSKTIPEKQLSGQFVMLHVTPERIDLVDDNRGWGVRETLEL